RRFSESAFSRRGIRADLTSPERERWDPFFAGLTSQARSASDGIPSSLASPHKPGAPAMGSLLRWPHLTSPERQRWDPFFAGLTSQARSASDGIPSSLASPHKPGAPAMGSLLRWPH